MCGDCRNDDVAVAHVPWRSRLEARVGASVVGALTYEVRGTWAVLTSTDAADPAVAHRLVADALTLLRSRGYRVLAQSPAALEFLAGHPDDLVGIDDAPVGAGAPSPHR